MGRRGRVALASVLLLTASPCARKSAKNVAIGTYRDAPVILISIDTLRADHLPAWGYRAGSTPNLDRLVSESVVFRNAYSHCPLTLPSHVSVLSGLLPPQHGVRDNIGFRFDPQGDTTLPQMLHRSGYRTGAAVSSYVLRGETGLRNLFDAYDDDIEFRPGSVLAELERPGVQTAALAQRWIDANRTKPFFYFLHIYEPHSPYTPPEPFRSSAPSAYDGEIAYADSIVGDFLNHLRQTGLYDRSIVIVIGDHGEGLGDHGESTHGLLLYREALHVPLIIKMPGGAGGGTTVDRPAGLTDVMPTVLSLVGIPAGAKTDGMALFGSGDAPRSIFSESQYGAIHLGWSHLRSLVDARYHYISAPRPELYDVANDSREKTNIVSDQRRIASSMRDGLAHVPDRSSAPSAMSPEEMRKLAALGYLTSRAVPSGSIDPKDGIASLSRFEAAMNRFNNGDFAGAERDLQALLKENPNFTDARVQLARIYETTRQYDQAADEYRRIIVRDPSFAEQVLIGLATAYLNLNRLSEARAHAEAARAFNPGGADLLLGRIALAASDPRGAERFAREAKADRHYKTAAALLEAEAVLAQRNSGTAARALGILDELKQQQSAGGKIIPGLELLRADALVRLDRPDDAVAALRSAIQQEPRNRDIYGRLAAIHFLRGNAAAADAVLEEMVRIDPSPAAYEFAARTLDHFGQTREAAAWRAREALR